MLLELKICKSVRLMYLKVQKQEWKFGLHFWRLNDGDKTKTNAFSGKKLTTNLCLLFFEFKVKQNRCARCI